MYLLLYLLMTLIVWAVSIRLSLREIHESYDKYVAQWDLSGYYDHVVDGRLHSHPKTITGGDVLLYVALSLICGVFWPIFFLVCGYITLLHNPFIKNKGWHGVSRSLAYGKPKLRPTPGKVTTTNPQVESTMQEVDRIWRDQQ